MRTPANRNPILVFSDGHFGNFGFVGVNAELGRVLTAIELVEPDFGGESIHFKHTLDDIDLGADEAKADCLIEDKFGAIVPIDVEKILAGD